MLNVSIIKIEQFIFSRTFACWRRCGSVSSDACAVVVVVAIVVGSAAVLVYAIVVMKMV